MLKSKNSQIRNLRNQLQRAKKILSRAKTLNKHANKELKDVMYESMSLNETNRALVKTVKMFMDNPKLNVTVTPEVQAMLK